jgi:hypothetical protein
MSTAILPMTMISMGSFGGFPFVASDLEFPLPKEMDRVLNGVSKLKDWGFINVVGEEGRLFFLPDEGAWAGT